MRSCTMTPKISVLVFISTLIDFGFASTSFFMLRHVNASWHRKKLAWRPLAPRNSIFGSSYRPPKRLKIFRCTSNTGLGAFYDQQFFFIRVAVRLAEKHHRCQSYHRKAYRTNKQASNDGLKDNSLTIRRHFLEILRRPRLRRPSELFSMSWR